MNRNVEALGHKDGTRLHDLGAERRHLEHFIVADGFEFPGLGDDPRVRGIDALHIGKDLTHIRLERFGQGDGL